MLYAETKDSNLESFNGIRECEKAQGWEWGTLTTEHFECKEETRDGGYLYQLWVITPPLPVIVESGERFWTEA